MKNFEVFQNTLGKISRYLYKDVYWSVLVIPKKN